LYDVVHDGKMPLDRKTRVSATEMETIRLWIETLSKDTSRPVAQLNQYDIIPIMLRHCTPCHGLTRQDAGLDLRTRASMVKGGKSGPALIPGGPEKSLMLQKVLSEEMPPKELFESGVSPLVEAEVEKLKQWIAQGAPEGNVQPDVAGTQPDPLVSDQDRQFWAFRPPRAVEAPSVRHRGWGPSHSTRCMALPGLCGPGLQCGQALRSISARADRRRRTCRLRTRSGHHSGDDG